MPFLRERSGRWSPVKIVAFVAALLPALWIAYQAAADELGARPVTEAIHQAGDWALRFLLITLAITPAQRIFNYPRIILARRTLGVACAGYAVLHFSLYVLDQHFDLDRCRHKPARVSALAPPPPPGLRDRAARRRAFLHPIQAQHLPAGADGGVPDVAAGVPRPLPAQRRGHPASPRASCRRRRRGDRDRRSDDLLLHQRRRRAAHPACPFRPRSGGATGVVGACRRPHGRRRRFLAAKARASALERASDLAQRRAGRGPGPIRQLMAKPSALALAVAPGVALCPFHRCGQVDLAVEMPDQPRHAVCFHGGERRIEISAPQRAHLVERAGGQHGIETGIDAAVEFHPLDIEEELDRNRGIERRLHALSVPIGERTAGRQNDLERAGDASAIPRHQAVRGRGVARAELGIERSGALALEPLPDR